MNKLYLYNTKSLKKELFVPLKENEVTIYVCGPTVYGHAHIGNARPIVVFDTLKRLLIELGYDVKYVSNYTDVDDKIINTSIKENISEKTLTKDMITAYNKVRDDLNTLPLFASPKVTETMDDIIKFIDDLVLKGYAYQINGDVYFRVNKIKDYGQLSHQNLHDLKVGSRINENTNKENPLDFVLWKETELGIKWPSKYSFGRPGWHSECVVMINKVLGPKIDIHAGGQDLRFPHHENELVQSLAQHNSDLANYWLHNGMLTFSGEKMSKSLGNLITAKDAIKEYGANVIRWLLLSNHYRDSLPFGPESINNAKKEVEKIEFAINQASLQLALNNFHNDTLDQDFYRNFINHMLDDLNTPNAYTEVLNSVKIINQLIRHRDIDLLSLAQKLNSLLKMIDILGLTYNLVKLDVEDIELYKNWQVAKASRNFLLADKLRETLQSKGIIR